MPVRLERERTAGTEVVQFQRCQPIRHPREQGAIAPRLAGGQVGMHALEIRAMKVDRLDRGGEAICRERTVPPTIYGQRLVQILDVATGREAIPEINIVDDTVF